MPNSMKPSSEAPSKANQEPSFWGGPALDLPVDPGFLSETQSLTVDQLFRLNLKLLDPGRDLKAEEERRLRDKCNVPFEL